MQASTLLKRAVRRFRWYTHTISMLVKVVDDIKHAVVRKKLFYDGFASFRRFVKVRPDETYFAKTNAGFILPFLFSRIFTVDISCVYQLTPV